MIKKLIKALDYLKEGQTLHLGNDVFLTGYLDGADKFYGFTRIDGKLYAIEDNEYPIQDMEEKDLEYIFGLSSPSIIKKISNKEYEIDND
jgi:hypothetical protein